MNSRFWACIMSACKMRWGRLKEDEVGDEMQEEVRSSF